MERAAVLPTTRGTSVAPKAVMENTMTSLSTTTLTQERDVSHVAVELDPLEALATKVFFYTLGYVVIFIVSTVVLISL
jgi:hypothetical protein